MELNDKNSLWVARDKDNELWLFNRKPERSGNTWECYDDFDFPDPRFEMIMNPKLFPDLTWDDLPEEVMISLKNPIYKMICPYCGKEITYHLSDIKHSYDYQPSSDYSDEWNYIVCPDCNKEVKIN